MNDLFNSNIEVSQLIGIIELVIGLFGYYVAYTFRRNSSFRFKLAVVYTFPIISGLVAVLLPTQQVHLFRHTMIIAYMLFITILYWREIKDLTTTTGFHKHALSGYLDNVPDLIWVKDLDHRYTYVNKALADTFRMQRREILGKTDIEIGRVLKKNGIQFDFDLICYKSDLLTQEVKDFHQFLEQGMIGETFYAFQVHKVPLFCSLEGKQDRIGYIGIARDLTANVKEHEEIERLFLEGRYAEAYAAFNEHKDKYDAKHFLRLEIIQEIAQQEIDATIDSELEK